MSENERHPDDCECVFCRHPHSDVARLRAELAQAREALRPFAAEPMSFDINDLRRARAVLAKAEGKE